MKLNKRKKTEKSSFLESRYIRWFLLVVVTIIITVLLYPNLVVKRHEYSLGDVTESAIKAPMDLLIEDKTATENSRIKAVQEVLTVYDYDDSLTTKLSKNIRLNFMKFRKLIYEEQQSKKTGLEKNSTYNETGKSAVHLNSEAQGAKYTGDEKSIPIIKDNILNKKDEKSEISTNTINNKNLINQIFMKKKEFEEGLNIKIIDVNFKTLIRENFSNDIENVIINILASILNNGVVSNKELLLQERGKGVILQTIAYPTEQIITEIKDYYDLDKAKAMVWIIGQPMLKGFRYDVITMIVDIVQALIQPNITLNKRQTEQKRQEAMAKIKPKYFQVKAGEMLLREGERINEEQLLRLEALKAAEGKENIYTKSIGMALLIISLLITLQIGFIAQETELVYKYNKELLFLSLVLILFVFIAEISIFLAKSLTLTSAYPISLSSMILSIPIAAGSMTVCLFRGMKRALPFAIIISLCTSILYHNMLEIFIFFFINSCMGAYWVRYCRERNVFIKAGVKIGLLNILVFTALRACSSELFLSQLVWDWIFSYIGGLSTGIVTAGLAPLLELTFGYATDITLLELANLNKPLLHKLMLEAPGTYHHSVIVGSMVEAAAKDIGANPLLAKVCGYYHDIGKLKNPLYFIENQPKGSNIHDKLAPSMSGLVIIAHVKHGIELAKKHKLGKDIMDTIEQHHGTSMIGYFYEKAKKKGGEQNVNEADFRYPGPSPNTREAGLVMLADVVEASSRALENPTPARIQGIVQKLINKVFSDGQLENCELTLKDLHKIARCYIKILNGIHHHRIEYNNEGSKRNGKGKTKNGSIDRKQPKQNTNRPGKSTNGNSEGLKRLGLS